MATGVKVYDIRHYGARPGPYHKSATWLAVQTIFNQIKQEYPDEKFQPQEGQSARIFFPFDGGEGWWVDQGLIYQGGVSVGLYLIGEHALARGGRQGTALVYDGPLGGTLLDLVAINGSHIQDLEFNLNNKAKIGVWLRHRYVQGKGQIGPSSGVNFHSCSFYQAGDFTDSALVAAGKDDQPGATFQASEYRFYNCHFQGRDVGPGSKQGWGFRAMNSGNTKNFAFNNASLPIFTVVSRQHRAMSSLPNAMRQT
jgi:hypothetical protein